MVYCIGWSMWIYLWTPDNSLLTTLCVYSWPRPVYKWIVQTFMHTRKYSVRFIYRDNSKLSVVQTFFPTFSPFGVDHLEIVDSATFTCSFLFNTFKWSAAMLLNNFRFSLFFFRVDMTISIYGHQLWWLYLLSCMYHIKLGIFTGSTRKCTYNNCNCSCVVIVISVVYFRHAS